MLYEVITMALSVYYYLGAKHELIVILKATAYIRTTIIFFFTAFALLKLVSPGIIIFSAIDLAGGVWTFLLLKKEGHL